MQDPFAADGDDPEPAADARLALPFADLNPAIRLVIITGGPGAGKTALCRALYPLLPKSWRFVPLDNFLGLALAQPHPPDWPEWVVRLAEVCMDFWKREKVYPVLVEGVVQTEEQVSRLARAFGVGWPSDQVRVIQLGRSLETHRRRRASDREWNPPLAPGQSRDDAFASLENRVPNRIPGARQIGTDKLTEQQVLAATLRHLV